MVLNATAQFLLWQNILTRAKLWQMHELHLMCNDLSLDFHELGKLSPTFFFLLLGLFSNTVVSDKGCGDVEGDWKFAK